MWSLVSSALTAIGAYAIYRWARELTGHQEVAFKERILRQAATWLQPNLNAPAEEIEDALHRLIELGEGSPILERIDRIECQIERGEGDQCRATTLVAVNSPQGVLLVGRISHDCTWMELPDTVRLEFIRHGEASQTFVLLEKRRAAEPAMSGGKREV